jgi:hypothetical protein
MSILPSRNSTGFEFIKTESNMALKKGELQYRNFESKAKAIGNGITLRNIKAMNLIKT